MKTSILPLVAASVLLAGCATPPPRSNKAAFEAYQQQNDPLKPANKVFYHFDNVLDTYVLRPVAVGYSHITTPAIREHVSDFMQNMDGPAELLEFMASGKPRDAGTTLVRFIVNSTVGIGGIFDPASAIGYKRVYTDLGLTLAGYGVPEGPYLYLPFAGPSDVRDASVLPAGFFLTPTVAAPPSTGLTIFNYSSDALDVVNKRANLLGTISNIKKSSLDPYATFRSLYRQHRAAQLRTINERDIATPPAWYPAKEREAMKPRPYGSP
ncbi:MlaA family lipoprotein [Acidiphilium sp.]|uniref:MlaA family lipoprotein n=1 Tax=Acidiphilium sp. TaxID=527 RepID=UPI003D0956CC